MKTSNLYGIIGSTLSSLIVFLILWFVVIPMTENKPQEDEGLFVSFGDSDNGGGMTVMPTSKPVKTVTSIPVSKSAKQDFMTQTDNSFAIAEQKRKNQEQAAIESQRLETKQKLAIQTRNEQLAIDKANAMNGMFGNSNSKGSGTGSGDNLQGNPAGKGSSGGNSWSLNGRLLTGQLVSPSYNRDVEGKITVNIKVDAKGNVISYTIGSPTTISDAETRNAAITAAKNTHFSSSEGISAGTITYNFKLK